jgi:ribosomal protein S18 acetylase RimI-like enzyme
MANLNDITKLIKVRFDYFATENWEVTNEISEQIHTQLQSYYSKHMNDDFFAAFVEDEDGNVVSTAFLVIVEKPANLSWPTGKTGTILNVLTYSDYRNKGYATMALNLLIDIAKKQDVSFIDLSASELGRSLYKKLGFQEKGSSHFTEMRKYLLTD